MTHKPEGDRPRISITQNANNSENVTQIGQAGDVNIDNSNRSVNVGGSSTGPIVTGDSNTVSDSSVHIGGDVSGTAVNIGSGSQTFHGDVVGRDKITNLQQTYPDIKELVTTLEGWVASQSDEFDQEEAQEAVVAIQEAVAQGPDATEEDINQKDVRNAMTTINTLGQDIVEVVDTIIMKGPAAGISTVVQKIWGKVKERFGAN